jgi:hypothetical protein
MSKIIYPHKIEFINRGKCSVCGLLTKKIVNTNLSHYFGWTSCNNITCDEIIKQSYDKNTISIEILIYKYGNNLKIQRSDYTIENNWEFDSNATKEIKNGPFWVFVKNFLQNKRKEVTLNSIEELNLSSV